MLSSMPSVVSMPPNMITAAFETTSAASSPPVIESASNDVVPALDR